MSLARRIWHIANVFTLAILLLSGRVVYWQLVRGQELQPVVLDPVAAAARYRGDEWDGNLVPGALEGLPQPVIQRTQALLAGIARGAIYDRDGRPLAYGLQAEGGELRRVYTDPSLAHVVGYVSGLRTGVTGIEASFNETLLGLDRFDTQVSRLVYQPVVGSNVYLTIDSQVQQAAAQALGDRAGAVVVLDATTGAVLAMVSQPAFDPNRILDRDYMAALQAGCGMPGCQGLFLNRATQGLYVPGSTWKTVTLIAALDTGLVAPDSVFDVGPPVEDERGRYYVYRVDGGVVIDRNHPEQVLNLERAFVTSANAVFGRLADELGADRLIEVAGRFGFGWPGHAAAPPLEIETSAAQLANNPDRLYTNNFLRAITGIGQGELLTSPLTMALVVAAVVNQGDVPNPHLLLAVRHPEGHLLREEPAGVWRPNTIRPQTAAQVRQMMIRMVESGSAAAVPGLTVGGKTGTAEVGGDQAPHAWFVGFAESAARTVAIAVVVEHGGQGGSVAAPIFARVAAAALN